MIIFHSYVNLPEGKILGIILKSSPNGVGVSQFHTGMNSPFLALQSVSPWALPGGEAPFLKWIVALI